MTYLALQKEVSSFLTPEDLYLFNEGSHLHLYHKLGSHPVTQTGISGTYFAVWAPDAVEVSVIGDFNQWIPRKNPLIPRDQSGIWEGFVPALNPGTLYKYHLVSRYNRQVFEKGDPFSFYQELPPKTASIVWNLDYTWNDAIWMKERHQKNSLNSPISIYEIHLGSWRHQKKGESLSYREMAAELTKYILQTGFTHVEFLPVMEHPFYASWGYQITNYFAATSRYGAPQDLMYLIDTLHQHGIGVILDWVPSHFPNDPHGLALFDGTALFEHADPRQGIHPDWNSCIFNYGRNEVRSFLLSNAFFWLDCFHADGLRVDAVASMLYLDYSRKNGEWIPNRHGGNENLEAVSFLRRLNEEVYRYFPDVQMIAEESTAWPMVSRPTYLGGLGFGLKWDMGWMNDTLRYFSKDPVFRKFHHADLTFRQIYSASENFILPLSHDEVVHGKGSLLSKMPGDPWQKFANVRLLFGTLYAQTGKKLLFMGNEFGTFHEWNHDYSLDWSCLSFEPHRGLKRWIEDLNHLYRTEPALHELDCNAQGFFWIDCHDSDSNVVSFIRKGSLTADLFLVVLNATPVPRLNYRVGVPKSGFWEEKLNSDSHFYGGSNLGNQGGCETLALSSHNQPFTLELTLPPLAILFLKKKGDL